MTSYDHRARLQPKNINRAEEVLGENDDSNILYPLYSTNGVILPYTPSITMGFTAEYDATPFVHTNYNYNAYVRSYPKDIGITSEFTAQTNDEALYLLAVMHFFRSVTKSYFGVNPYNKAGTPPPVLLFSYLGEHQFNRVPVIVKSFDYTLHIVTGKRCGARVRGHPHGRFWDSKRDFLRALAAGVTPQQSASIHKIFTRNTQETHKNHHGFSQELP